MILLVFREDGKLLLLKWGHRASNFCKNIKLYPGKVHNIKLEIRMLQYCFGLVKPISKNQKLHCNNIYVKLHFVLFFFAIQDPGASLGNKD